MARSSFLAGRALLAFASPAVEAHTPDREPDIHARWAITLLA